MASHITITKAGGRHRIIAGGMPVGETSAALSLQEGSYPAVLYVPRADVDMTRLRKETRQTTCPWKGDASYYSVITEAGTLDHAVWSYETPKPGMEAIAGHLAFYPDKVQVEAV